MRLLNVEQALEDIANFIYTLKSTCPVLSKSKVLVSGCSYAGTLAAWLRLKYPHLVDFAYAGSASVEETPGGMGDFYQVIADYLKKQGNNCFEKVDAAASAIVSLVEAKKNDELSTLFDDDVNLISHADQQSFIDNKFNTPLWQNAQYDPEQLQRLCEEMANGNGTGAEIYANWFNTLPSDDDNTNKSRWENLKDEIEDRPWTWQVCTQLGSFEAEKHKFPFAYQVGWSDSAYDCDTSECLRTSRNRRRSQCQNSIRRL